MERYWGSQLPDAIFFPSHIPATTAAKPIPTFSTTFPIASPWLWSFTCRTVSAPKVEKVVNAPRNPTPKSNFRFRFASSCPLPINSPIKKQPITLAISVPTGNEVSQRYLLAPAMPYRQIAPTNPPAPIRKQSNRTVFMRFH